MTSRIVGKMAFMINSGEYYVKTSNVKWRKFQRKSINSLDETKNAHSTLCEFLVGMQDEIQICVLFQKHLHFFKEFNKDTTTAIKIWLRYSADSVPICYSFEMSCW